MEARAFQAQVSLLAQKEQHDAGLLILQQEAERNRELVAEAHRRAEEAAATTAAPRAREGAQARVAVEVARQEEERQAVAEVEATPCRTKRLNSTAHYSGKWVWETGDTGNGAWRDLVAWGLSA